jgi:hypothetical protein
VIFAEHREGCELVLDRCGVQPKVQNTPATDHKRV